MKNYTYNDWLDGTIRLSYSPMAIKNPADFFPLAITWDRIVESDIPKIKAKQEELFNEQWNVLFISRKNSVHDRLNRALNKNAFLESLIKAIYDLLYGPPEPEIMGFYINPAWKLDIPYENYLGIRIYVQKRFLGEQIEYDFMASPDDSYRTDNFNYQDKTFTGVPNANVHCHFYLKYCDWLKEMLKEIKATPEPPPSNNENPGANDSIDEVGNNTKPEEEIKDVLQERIEKYFEPFKKTAFINDADYSKAFNAIYNYFKDERTNKVEQPIFVRSGNIIKICRALGRIHRDTIGYEVIGIKYMEFAKTTFDCLQKQKIEEDEITRSTFYKYFKG